jgi:hypothetical protein
MRILVSVIKRKVKLKLFEEEIGGRRLFGPVREDVRGGWKKIAYCGIKYACHRIIRG